MIQHIIIRLIIDISLHDQFFSFLHMHLSYETKNIKHDTIYVDKSKLDIKRKMLFNQIVFDFKFH